MSFTEVFGGTTLYPAGISYLPLTLDADKSLAWPLESNDPENPAASIIDVTTSGAFSVTLPDATQTGAGQTILFNNLSASSNSFLVKDAAGATLATIGIGEQWQVYLAGTATAAGTWRVLRYGASTATVQPSALAGYGLTVTSNTLSQSLPVTTFNSGPRTVLLTDRASALVWSGTGAGVLNLPSAATAGNNFFIGVRNSGGGDLTVDAAGSELIDGAATLTLRPGDSANLLTDGLSWYTLGLGQQAVFAFDYTSISVTGGTYTLAGSELNRIVYKFVGVLAADQYIVVPATVQQYWVDNATTGAYNLYLRTSAGTPVAVTQGGRGIYYCNGANVIDADTSTVALPISVANGGTGITSYSTGDLVYASAASTLSKLSGVAVGNVLLSSGVGAAPAWGKVSLTSAVSGTLPIANGGTGAADAATARSNLGAGSVTSVSGAGSVNGLTLTGTVTSSGSLTLGGTLANVSLTTQVTGALPVANGGTGTATAFTAGSLVFAGAAGTYSQDNANLFWNNTTKALAVGGSVSVTGELQASGTTSLGGTVLTGLGVSTGGVALEIGSTRTGDGVAYVDLHSTAGSDYEARFLREAGANGTAQLVNKGTGPLILLQEGAGAITMATNGVERVRISATGALTSSALANAVGYKGLPQNAQGGNFTFDLTQMGQHVLLSGAASTCTIPPNSSVAFEVGSAITLVNDGSAGKTLAQGVGVTLKLAGSGATGNRTLAVGALATIVKVATDTWYVSGAGVS